MVATIRFTWGQMCAIAVVFCVWGPIVSLDFDTMMIVKMILAPSAMCVLVLLCFMFESFDTYWVSYINFATKI